jgi:hypothetical protein
MPTTVHIPPRLLAAAQRRARTLGISRNRLIVRALEREVADVSSWSPRFLETLRETDSELADAAGRLARETKRLRRSKAPRQL